MTLAWDPPSDGVTVGYVVYYGQAPQTYTWQQDVGFVTGYTVQNLQPGAYYFAVRAKDSAGTLSDPSNEVATTVAAATITALSLVANVVSPQQVGTYVTWTAIASGGLTPYQFRWWQTKGTTTTLLRDWQAVSTLMWSPTIGDYMVTVDGRSAGGSAVELSQSVPFAIKKCSGRSCK